MPMEACNDYIQEIPKEVGNDYSWKCQRKHAMITCRKYPNKWVVITGRNAKGSM